MSFGGPRRLSRRLVVQFARLPVVGVKLIEHYLRRRYGRRVVTPGKARNFLEAKRDLFRGAATTSSLPYILNLDLFNGCNLKCPFCATGTNQHERDKARMPLATARRVLDLVQDHALEVRLYNWGEPFLNDDVFEVVRYARERGLHTVINSNLSLRVRDLAERVVASGLDVLQVSLDGLRQETLQVYRRRGDLRLVFDNVRAIAAERAKRGVPHPRLDIAFLVFRHNEHEIGELEAVRRELGADRLFPRRAFIYERDWVPAHPRFQPLGALFRDRCDYLYTELTVEATGAVSPCCTNTSAKWDIGTVADVEDLPRFWNGEAMRAMRSFEAGGAAGGKSPVLCQFCGLVGRNGARPAGALSPLPPALVAAGKAYDTGAGDLLARVAR